MSEEKQLVTIQPVGGLAKPAAGSSWGDIQDEIRPRYLRLKTPKTVAQAMENFTNGHYVDTAIGRSWATMEIVILWLGLTRKLKSPYREGEVSELWCRSTDRIVPVTNDRSFEPKSDDCKSCPYGELAWANWDADTKTGKPDNPCEKEVEILFIEKVNPTQPYRFVFNGKDHLGVAEQLRKTMIALARDTFGRTGRFPEMYEYIIRMGSEQNKQRRYVPTFPSITEVSRAEAEEKFGAAYHEFVVARNNAFAARQEAAAKHQAVANTGQQKVIETPAQEATKPEVSFVPPPSKRVAGTKPVYVPPTIEAQAEIVPDDEEKVEP